MNYRHHFHAGNFADVVKHVLLVQLVRAMQRKPTPFVYLDTHAARGMYDLTMAATGDTLARTPEWPDGIGRLWRHANLPPSVADYVEAVRKCDRQHGNLEPIVRFYPGSPKLVASLVRPQDRLSLCEMHPSECAALRDQFSIGRAHTLPPNVSVHEMDGYVAIRAMLPPPERRALVLVDPSYEAQDEFSRVAAALQNGLRRFPGGVYALWYPLTERARIREFFTAITAINPPPTLVAELGIAGDESARKLKGCGLVIVNPPWQFDREASETLQFLGTVLAQEPGGIGRVTWLVDEK